MATTVHLVRHAAHELVDRVLVARSIGAALSSAGLRQAQALVSHFIREPIASVQSSPQLRARQTGQPIADSHGLPLEIAPEIDEINMGAWSGRSFDELKDDPHWLRWNSQRDATRPPHGESIREVQNRMLAHLARVCAAYRGERILVVSHAEPIRAAILHYLGLSPDDFLRVRIDPASVTTISFRERNIDIALNRSPLEGLVAA